MSVSPGDSSGSNAAIVDATYAAGTISQMCRGGSQRVDHLLRCSCPTSALGLHRRDGGVVDVVGDALVAARVQATNHVGAHAPQTDHGDLHARTGCHGFEGLPSQR